MNNISKDNFFTETFAVFKGCKKPHRKPDYISKDRFGDISSIYWYNEKKGYVIRYSQHWSKSNNCNFAKSLFACGRIASCYWELRTVCSCNGCGKAYFSTFKGRSGK